MSSNVCPGPCSGKDTEASSAMSERVFSRIEDPAVQQLMPTKPQVHGRHNLASVFGLEEPDLLKAATNQILQVLTREDSLSHVGTHDGSSDRGTHDRFGVI